MEELKIPKDLLGDFDEVCDCKKCALIRRVARSDARIQELEAALRIILKLPSTDNVMDQASLVGEAYFAASDALGVGEKKESK